MKKFLLLTAAVLLSCTGFAAEKPASTLAQKARVYVRYILKNLEKGQSNKNLRIIDKNCLVNGKDNFYNLNLALAMASDGLAKKDFMQSIKAFYLMKNKKISAEQQKKLAALKGTEQEKAFFTKLESGLKMLQDKFAAVNKEMKFAAVLNSGNTYYVVTSHNNEANIYTLRRLKKSFKLVAMRDVPAADWKKLQPITLNSIKNYLNNDSSKNIEDDLEI